MKIRWVLFVSFISFDPKALIIVRLPPLEFALWLRERKTHLMEARGEAKQLDGAIVSHDKNKTSRQSMRIINGSRENVSCGALKLIRHGKCERERKKLLTKVSRLVGAGEEIAAPTKQDTQNTVLLFIASSCPRFVHLWLPNSLKASWENFIAQLLPSLKRLPGKSDWSHNVAD